MKILAIAFVLTFIAGCNRDDHHQTPGEVAGKTAYEVQKDVKKASKELSKDLKSFGHDAREGFQEARQKDLQRKKEKDEK
jgi:hypothetical protein